MYPVFSQNLGGGFIGGDVKAVPVRQTQGKRVVFVIGLFGHVEIFKVARVIREAVALCCRHDSVHEPFSAACINMPARLIGGQYPFEIGAGAFVGHMQRDPVRSGHMCKIREIAALIAASDRIVELEIAPQCVKAVGKGDHGRDADPAAHEETFAGCFVEFEMVDRFGHEHPATFGK